MRIKGNMKRRCTKDGKLFKDLSKRFNRCLRMKVEYKNNKVSITESTSRYPNFNKTPKKPDKKIKKVPQSVKRLARHKKLNMDNSFFK